MVFFSFNVLNNFSRWAKFWANLVARRTNEKHNRTVQDSQLRIIQTGSPMGRHVLPIISDLNSTNSQRWLCLKNTWEAHGNKVSQLSAQCHLVAGKENQSLQPKVTCAGKKEKTPDFKICIWLRKPNFYSPCTPCFDLSYSNFICTDPGSPISMCNHEHQNPCWYSPHPYFRQVFSQLQQLAAGNTTSKVWLKLTGSTNVTRLPISQPGDEVDGDGMKDRSNLGVTIFFHLQM